MSAFIISDLHTFTIAEFIANRLADSDSYADRQQLAQNLANSLKRANIDSVNYRYNQKTPRARCKPRQVTIKQPAAVWRLCECWRYQTCEDSNAADFHALNALLSATFTEHEKEQGKTLELWSI